MRAKVIGVFIGITEGEFKPDNSSDTIKFRNASFAVRNSAETFVLKVRADADMSHLRQFDDAYMLVDCRYDAKFKNYTCRIIQCFANEKELNAASYYTDDELTDYGSSVVDASAPFSV